MDRLACFLVLPLCLWILLSGIDDLIVDVAGLLSFIRSRFQAQPSRRQLLDAPQQRIAVFVPCWHESSVIADMVTRNRERIKYRNYDFFIGAYPNDEDTAQLVGALERRLGNVHLALCPHPGPTSKADCLNWIYQRMLLFETAQNVHFDIIVTHDAEDVIHPDAFHWINWHSGEYDMVQVPVLPLPTPVTMWTHGVYCDEFVEYQCRDMPARQFMGAFVPSNGVGTGFRRSALEKLALAEGNRIFEPACLTEDYENGLRLKLHGAKQIFVKVQGQTMATQEYFPTTFRTAVRQRTRWVTGIALQTWQRHGWTGSLVDRYWLWRDRKGLIGNPATLLTNLLSGYGAVAGTVCCVEGWPWSFGERLHELAPLLACTAGLGIYRIVFRMFCVARNFGPKFASLVPFRVIIANCINCLATVQAVLRYASARLRSEPLRWVKTEHQFPSPAALQAERKLFVQILVENGYVTGKQLDHALATRPPGCRLGEHLMSLGYLAEDDLYDALSQESQIPHRRLHPADVRLRIARALPAAVSEQWNVLPFQVEDGTMLLASSEVPHPVLTDVLRRYTNLELRFHLVTVTCYRQLVEELL